MLRQSDLVLGRPLRILSLGIEEFAVVLRDAGVTVTHLDWHPPAGGDQRLIRLLDAMAADAPRSRPTGRSAGEASGQEDV